MNRPTFLLFVAAATLGTRQGGAVEAEDFLHHSWYRLEMIIFEQSPAVAAREGFRTAGIAARKRLLDAVRYPNNAFTLAEKAGATGNRYPFASPLAVDTAVPLVISNLPPPTWFAGPSVAERWEPPIHRWLHPFEVPQGVPPDPCLGPDPWQAELDGMELAMHQSVPGPSPDSARNVDPVDLEEAARETVDRRRQLADALSVAFEEYEDQLQRASYVWERATPRFAAQRATLAGRYEIIAAGNWHQPLPPREEPQPLVIQVGAKDDARRFLLEGWLSVTLGRFVHLEVMLEYRLGDGAIALVAEQRRMRSDEPHYLDHPAIGILARADPVPLPEELGLLLDELEELGQ